MAEPASSVSLAALPPATRIAVRADKPALPILGTAFGVEFPIRACRAAVAEGRAALWLGPDEWLVVAPDADAAALIAEATRALAGIPASLVDVSHRQTAIAISGPRAAPALNAFVPLDLDPHIFPAGSCTRTLLAKAEIVLWRTAATEFRIEAFRSFSPYVWRCLEEAIREFGPEAVERKP